MIYFIYIVVYTLLYIIDLNVLGVNITTILLPFILTIFLYKKTKVLSVFLKDKFFVSLSLSIIFTFFVVFYYNSFLDGISVLSILLYVIASISFPLFINKKNIQVINLITLFFLSLFIFNFFYEFSIINNTLEIIVFKFSHRTSLAYQIFYTYVFFALTSNHKNKFLNLSISLLVFLSLIINTSRGPLLMFFLFILIYYKRFYSLKTLSLILLPLLVIFIFNFQEFFQDSLNRIVNFYNLDSSGGSTLYRYEAHRSILEYLSVYPFGNGLNSFATYFNDFTFLNLKTAINIPSDSTFVWFAYNTGYLGFIMFIISIFFLLKNNYSNSVALIISFCFLINCFTDEKLNGSIFISLLPIYYAKFKL